MGLPSLGCNAVICVTMQYFFFLTHTPPNLVHFESFLIEYLAALAFSAVAVALGGLWGIVPDRAASGAITEQAPDCSLLPSSSLPCLSCVCCSRRVNERHTNARTFSAVRGVYHSLASPFFSENIRPKMWLIRIICLAFLVRSVSGL